MNVKKLDKRFKLYKSGMSTHMTEVSVEDFAVAYDTMTAAYGMGKSVNKWSARSRIPSDWFWNFQNKKTDISIQISTTKHGQPVYSHRVQNVLTYRVFFRREEQATYLALKMA